MSPLDKFGFVDRHVVPEIVKTQLVVGAVGDVGGVSLPALRRLHAGNHQTHTQTHVAVDLAHPLRVTLGKIFVDGDHMDTTTGQCVQIAGQNGDQGLTFAGLHFRDTALVQDDAAHQLDRVGTHAQNPVGGLPDGGEGLGQDVVQSLALGQTVLEFLSFALQLFLGKIFVFIFQRQDFVHGGLDLFDLPLRAGTK